MRFFVVLFAVLASTSVASAESYDANTPGPVKGAYVGLGAEVGEQRALMAGLKLDGGYRLGDTSLFARGQITAGYSGSDGRYQQVRVGIESRSCALGGLLCAFGGVDVGYQHDDMIDQPWCLQGDTGGGCSGPDMTEAHDLMAVPRVGLELGTPIRFRAAFDLPLTTRLDERENRVGGALSLGAAVAF
jgi:hypothetical protein